jgi:hypothetical protein
MSSNTKYIVRNAEGTDLVTKSKKAQAVAEADKLADASRGEAFSVFTSAGTEVHVALRKTQGKHAAPWTRVDASEKIDLEVPAGYEVGYVRTRIPALVCRATDKSGWLIVTPEGNLPAKDTIEAREITNRLGAEAAQARLEAKEALKAERAKAREEAKAAKAAAAEAPAEDAEVA